MTIAEKEEVLGVSLGELKIGRGARDVLVAFGLGSCVAVCLADPVARVAGMAHVVLPESSSGGEVLPGKYGDLAVSALLSALVQAGGRHQHLVLKIAGGARVLAVPGLGQGSSIGERNAQAVREAAARAGLRIVASDIGGHVGRTVRLHAFSGLVTVQTAGHQVTRL